MSRGLRAVTGIALVALAGFGCFMAVQTLDDADKWASVAGFFVSALLGGGGILLGWRGLRQGGPSGAAAGPPSTKQTMSHLVAGRDITMISSSGDVDHHRHG